MQTHMNSCAITGGSQKNRVFVSVVRDPMKEINNKTIRKIEKKRTKALAQDQQRPSMALIAGSGHGQCFGEEIH